MLEIMFLIWFGRSLSRIAAAKNRSKGWAALGVAFWIGGEVSGMVLAVLLGLTELSMYGFALALAGAGAAVSYVIVKNLPDAQGAYDAALTG